MKQMFKFICCGNVDDGKSTLIGRILLDTENVKKDQLEDAKKASQKNGAEGIELAMLLDGLLSEREQQITIDIAHRYFDYQDVRFHILDCPGHKQYTKNMAIAAAEVDSAIVVIDVTKGIQEQTESHIEICSLFGLKNICICLTKCDLISDSAGVPNVDIINQLTADIRQLMSAYHFNWCVIPVSAVTGYHIDQVLEQVCRYAAEAYQEQEKIQECIIHIQAAKLYHGERYYYGREINGIEPVVGKQYVLWPNNIPITVTNNPTHGCFQIAENVDVSAGDCIANCPVILSNFIKHHTIWFEPPTENMLLKHGTRVVHVVHYTDNQIELDNQLVFNNIEDVKQNGFGIFIDVVTKKTLGCCVFTQNQQTDATQQPENKIYLLTATREEDVLAKEIAFVKSFNLPPVVLNAWQLKKSLFQEEELPKKVFELASLLQKQGFHVVVMMTPAQADALPEEANIVRMPIQES